MSNMHVAGARSLPFTGFAALPILLIGAVIKIVGATDWSILGRRPYEKLVLSACYPLYAATHRIIIFARLIAQSTTSRL
jgi:hypothetical protein